MRTILSPSSGRTATRNPRYSNERRHTAPLPPSLILPVFGNNVAGLFEARGPAVAPERHESLRVGGVLQTMIDVARNEREFAGAQHERFVADVLTGDAGDDELPFLRVRMTVDRVPRLDAR